MTPPSVFRWSNDLARALTDLRTATGPAVGETALRVVVYCGFGLLTGEAAPNPAGMLTADQLTAAENEFRDTLAGWSVAIGRLEDEWYACASPIDADDLCGQWLDRRTEGWAAEAGFATAGRSVDVSTFDAAVRRCETVLATLVGSRWYENLIRPFRADGADELPWWLSDHLARVAAETDRRAEKTFPPHGYLATVRQVAMWKAGEPAGIGVMAASTNQPVAVRRFVWRSPDGKSTATLVVHNRLRDVDRRAQLTPLMFESAPGRPAVGLAGTPFRMGRVADKISPEGEFAATVADWWAESDGRLYIGTAGVEWPLVTNEEESA